MGSFVATWQTSTTVLSTFFRYVSSARTHSLPSGSSKIAPGSAFFRGVAHIYNTPLGIMAYSGNVGTRSRTSKLLMQCTLDSRFLFAEIAQGHRNDEHLLLTEGWMQMQHSKKTPHCPRTMDVGFSADSLNGGSPADPSPLNKSLGFHFSKLGSYEMCPLITT